MKITRRKLRQLIYESISPGDGELNDDEAKMLQQLSKDAADEEPMEKDREESTRLDPAINKFLDMLENKRLDMNKLFQRHTRSAFGNPNGTRMAKAQYLIAKDLPAIFNQISKNDTGSYEKLIDLVHKLGTLIKNPKITEFKNALLGLAKMLKR